MKNQGVFLPKGIAGAISITCFILTVTGCDFLFDNSSSDFPVAFVSIYQCSPDAPALDVEVDQRLIFRSFDFGEYTGYQRFFTGDRDLRFTPYGYDTVLIDTTVNFQKFQAYSVFVVNEYRNISLLVLNDSTKKPAAKNSNLRVINLSPDSPPIDLAIVNKPETIVNGVAFKEASGFTEIASAKYDFQIRLKSNNEVILSLTAVTLKPGTSYTIIVRGYSVPPSGNLNTLSGQLVVN